MSKNTAKETVQAFALKQALRYVEGNPEENLPRLAELADKLLPEGMYPAQRKAILDAIESRGNWYQLMLRFFELDPGVRKTFFENFIFNASIRGGARQQELARKYDCNIPWAILLDPTSACNLRCTGCWAAEYGHQLNLSLEDIDSIIRQGKELGVYMYIYTGGEPLVRKKDLIRLCQYRQTAAADLKRSAAALTFLWGSQIRATPVSRAACATAFATAGPTRGSNAAGMMYSAVSSSSPINSASARAAASFISSLISLARTSNAPRKMPGKASTLLIWLG